MNLICIIRWLPASTFSRNFLKNYIFSNKIVTSTGKISIFTNEFFPFFMRILGWKLISIIKILYILWFWRNPEMNSSLLIHTVQFHICSVCTMKDIFFFDIEVLNHEAQELAYVSENCGYAKVTAQGQFSESFFLRRKRWS